MASWQVNHTNRPLLHTCACHITIHLRLSLFREHVALFWHAYGFVAFITFKHMLSHWFARMYLSVRNTSHVFYSWLACQVAGFRVKWHFLRAPRWPVMVRFACWHGKLSTSGSFFYIWRKWIWGQDICGDVHMSSRNNCNYPMVVCFDSMVVLGVFVWSLRAAGNEGFLFLGIFGLWRIPDR